jgi:hypothetical protein
LDACHLQGLWQGILYICTVKTPLDDLYPFAFGITLDNENTNGWDFLKNLKDGIPILSLQPEQGLYNKYMCLCLIGIKVWRLVWQSISFNV